MSERPRWRKKRWWLPALTFLMLAIMAGFAWTNRIDIADGYLADQLEQSGLPATYEIDRIGGQTQIISDLVIGDPAAPDLTAKQVIVRLRHRFGLPQVQKITLVEPRLYGRFLDGTLTFGSLDNLLYAESDEPSGLPDIEMALRDGRGLVESDYGPVGLKLAGEGNLQNGFEGMLAAVAPELKFGPCSAQATTLFGTLRTSGGRPKLSGPIRSRLLECDDLELAANDLVAETDLEADEQLSSPQIDARLSSGAARVGRNSAQSLSGTLRAQLSGEAMTARYSIAARGARAPVAMAAVLTAEGAIRSQRNFAAIDVESDIEGNGLRLGEGFVEAVDGVARTGEGSLLEPLLRQLASALVAQARGSSLGADLRYRMDERGYALTIPRAEVRGGGGARLASASRVEISSRDAEIPNLSGNIATAGPGLPSINGRMERAGNGDAIFRLTMQPYEAGGSQIAIPQMLIAQGSSGALGLSGTVEASGPLPGGAVDGLSLPISGMLSSTGQLILWRDCTRIGFRRLAFAELNIAGPGVNVCPKEGDAILRAGPGETRFAAFTPFLNLRGSLGDTPLTLSSGELSISNPGAVRASDLDISLGSGEDISRFELGSLEAELGEIVTGSFDTGTVQLSAVPMDLHNLAGDFTFSGGRLVVAKGSFRLFDREEADRFEPLVARDAQLTFADSVLKAQAALRNQDSDRIVTRLDLQHDLASGGGFADLSVDGLLFDEDLQPVDLSQLALGVIANAEGVVDGQGRVDWQSDGEITSTGAFNTDSLDFAAAFGPVKGVSGTINFTDLVNLTTAPDQTLRIASINPGVEVFDGEIRYMLRNGEVLSIAGGSWPFMGGELILRPFDFNFLVSEERSYVFEIVGLDAAQSLAQMELENLNATGTFDGTVPIIFDTDGNGRIEEGILLSRPPGGNISYVGELTYEDLSAIGNFAFDALRSLDYSQMRVIMDGPLTGEIITRVRFDGVKQGEGAQSNFVTRQIARLPLQFRVNIRAEFYQLMTSFKAMYDPSSVRDPRDLGLLTDDGVRLRRSITGEEAQPDIDPEDVIPDEPSIQDQESEQGI